MVCAVKGYPLVVTMAENFSVERRKLMRFLGARVVLTPARREGHRDARQGRRAGAPRTAGFCAGSSRTKPTPTCIRARPRRRSSPTSRQASSTTSVYRRRYRRHAQGRLHACSAAPAGNQDRRVRARQLAGLAQRHAAAAWASRGAQGSHPLFRPHLMQGWSPDFIRSSRADAAGMGLVDEVSADRRRRRDCICRASSRSAKASSSASPPVRRSPGRCGWRKSAPPGCDHPVHAARHRRALPLHAAVRRHLGRHDGRRARDLAVDPELPVRSTAAPRRAAVRPRGRRPAIRRWWPRCGRVRRASALADPEHPVVMFALEWCEFCWAVRSCSRGARSRIARSISTRSRTRPTTAAARSARRSRRGPTVATIPQVFCCREPQ